MSKVILYAVGVDFLPKTLGDVRQFAEDNDKFRVCEANTVALERINPGDRITTKKGNVLYALNVFDNGDDPEILEISRNYNLHRSQILGIENVTSQQVWDKSIIVKPLKKENKMNSVKSIGDKLKSMFMPSKAEDVHIAMDGNICVATSEGYVSIDTENKLVSYPSEFVIDLPAYIISKPVDQLKAGDVIAKAKSYAKVTKINADGTIEAISYTGNGTKMHTIQDFLLKQNLVRVVVSLAGSIGGTFNPMMLLAMSEDTKSSNLLPLMLMSQNNGILQQNPMMAAMLLGDGVDTKSLLMMSMMGGQNPFAPVNK